MSNNNDNDDEEKQIVTNPKDPIYTDMSSNTNNYKLVQLNNRCYWCGSCCYNDNIDEDHTHNKSTSHITENNRNIQEQHIFKVKILVVPETQMMFLYSKI